MTTAVEIRHARCFVAGFTADTRAVTRAIDAESAQPGTLRPLRIRPGRTMCMLVFVDYVDGDLGPYNEFGVCFLVEDPTTPPASRLDALRKLMRGDARALIHRLPVDGDFTLAAGRGIWGFPKTLAEFEVDHSSATRRGRLVSDGALVAERYSAVLLPLSAELPFEDGYHTGPAALYGLVAQRHMYEFGTTSEQLAWVKVAASHHAQHNPHALLRNVVTVEEVVSSPIVASPLHRLDCCVMSDGGGAIIVTRPEIARSLKRPLVRLRGAGEAVKHSNGGKIDLTYSAGVRSAAMAFEEARATPADIKYASLYDSFTITVVVQVEDIGFCEKGQGGRFVADGNLISGVGRLPFNTDGGGLCSNHPGNRGGITKILEAVRQARGEAHPEVQVPNCDLVIAHGTGGSLAGYHGSATAILERM